MHTIGGLLQYSTYSVGLAYEQLVLKVLKRYGFQLVHTGGPGDEGQDFNGFWLFPHKKIPVVGQCKCLKQAMGPAGVREWGDVLHRQFSDVPSQSINSYIGIMASKSWFTGSALKTVRSSREPMLACQILPRREEGFLAQLVLNQAAQKSLGDETQVVWVKGIVKRELNLLVNNQLTVF